MTHVCADVREDHTCRDNLHDQCITALAFSDNLVKLTIGSARANACGILPEGHSGLWDFERAEVFEPNPTLDLFAIRLWIEKNRSHPFVSVSVGVGVTSRLEKEDALFPGMQTMTVAWYHPYIHCKGCGVPRGSKQYLDPRFEAAFPAVWALSQLV